MTYVKVTLVSHVNNDGDIIQAWLDHYRGLGVEEFHLVLHGAASENAALADLVHSYPVVVRDAYQGEFLAAEKQRRVDALLATLAGRWVFVVDSDEFVEIPHHSLAATIRALERANADTLPAPMIQRIRIDGSLESSPAIADPSREFPLCSVDLYRHMGVSAAVAKYPLVLCRTETRLIEAGNHHPPLGSRPPNGSLRGVTHHYKWRTSTLERIRNRATSGHEWRAESEKYLEYLVAHRERLPLKGAFLYSRRALFERDLLRRPSWHRNVAEVVRQLDAVLPQRVHDVLRRAYRVLRGRMSR